MRDRYGAGRVVPLRFAGCPRAGGASAGPIRDEESVGVVQYLGEPTAGRIRSVYKGGVEKVQ
ncbi:MAG: hypothetical protein OXL41_00520 [Nitrospinae bacterium]|nr:hypothetical protein [Nitrospinota bacterium]